MTLLVFNAVTVVAGHLLSGKRRTAYGFLAALVSLPVVVIFAQAIWISLRIPDSSNADVIGAGLFVFGLVTLSAVSTLLLWRRCRASTAQFIHPFGSRMAELIVVCLLSFALICGSAISFIVIPFASVPEAAERNTPSVLGRRMPTEKGSLALAGQVLVAGSPAVGIKFVFLFAEDYVSPDIVTDVEGRFRYVLPPGKWRLLSPFVPSKRKRDLRFRFDNPLPTGDQGINFVVSVGKVVDTYSMTIELD